VTRIRKGVTRLTIHQCWQVCVLCLPRAAVLICGPAKQSESAAYTVNMFPRMHTIKLLPVRRSLIRNSITSEAKL